MQLDYAMAVEMLTCRGLSARQIANALGTYAVGTVLNVSAEARKDGSVQLYRDECVARAVAELRTHPERAAELAEYLYVRSVPIDVICEKLSVNKKYAPLVPERKAAYQARQLELAKQTLQAALA